MTRIHAGFHTKTAQPFGLDRTFEKSHITQKLNAPISPLRANPIQARQGAQNVDNSRRHNPDVTRNLLSPTPTGHGTGVFKSTNTSSLPPIGPGEHHENKVVQAEVRSPHAATTSKNITLKRTVSNQHVASSNYLKKFGADSDWYSDQIKSVQTQYGDSVKWHFAVSKDDSGKKSRYLVAEYLDSVTHATSYRALSIEPRGWTRPK